jgi:hypothetical protein
MVLRHCVVFVWLLTGLVLCLPPCLLLPRCLVCQAGKKHYCINTRVLRKGKSAVDEECEALLRDAGCALHGKGKETMIQHGTIQVG